jgi:hypothetical protein
MTRMDIKTLLRQFRRESMVTDASHGKDERQDSHVDEMTWNTPIEPLGLTAQQ